MESNLWRRAVTTFGAISVVVLLLSLSEVPEWIDRWSRILSQLTTDQIHGLVYIACGLIILVTNLPWLLLLIPKEPKQTSPSKHAPPSHKGGPPSQEELDKCKAFLDCEIDRRKEAVDWVRDVKQHLRGHGHSNTCKHFEEVVKDMETASRYTDVVRRGKERLQDHYDQLKCRL